MLYDPSRTTGVAMAGLEAVRTSVPFPAGLPLGLPCKGEPAEPARVRISRITDQDA